VSPHIPPLCTTGDSPGRVTGFLFCCSVYRQLTTVLKRKNDHSTMVLDFMKNRERLWNTEFEHCKKIAQMHYRKLYRNWIVWNSQYM